MRFHALAQECKSHNLTPLFIFGADYIPADLSESLYDKIILPKISFNHAISEFERGDLKTLHSQVVNYLLECYLPEYFVESHVSSILSDFNIFKQKKGRKIKRVAVLRDIVGSPRKIEEFNSGPEKFLDSLKHQFSAILIAGMQSKFDVIKEYSFPETIQSKMSYIGYILNPFIKQELAEIYDVVISFGSGQNRESHIQFVINRLMPVLDALNVSVCIFKGKYNMDHFSKCIYKSPKINIVDFSDRNSFLSTVSACKVCVLSGGYNTMMEAISLSKQILLIRDGINTEIETRGESLSNYFASINMDEDFSNKKLDSVVTCLLEKNENYVNDFDFAGIKNFFKVISSDSYGTR